MKKGLILLIISGLLVSACGSTITEPMNDSDELNLSGRGELIDGLSNRKACREMRNKITEMQVKNMLPLSIRQSFKIMLKGMPEKRYWNEMMEASYQQHLTGLTLHQKVVILKLGAICRDL